MLEINRDLYAIFIDYNKALEESNPNVKNGLTGKINIIKQKETPIVQTSEEITNLRDKKSVALLLRP